MLFEIRKKFNIGNELLDNFFLYKPDECLLDTEEFWMVLNDWMKLGVTEDEEDSVAHEIVSFAPEIEVQTWRNCFYAEK